MTLLLDIAPEAQIYFDDLRTQYFPKHKLRDNAHITLLYQIHDSVATVIRKLSAIPVADLTIEATKMLPFKTGNAIQLHSEGLKMLHQELKKTLKGKIAKRDLVKYKPHITIQLHCTAFKAQQTYQTLQTAFQPFAFKGIGMSLWNKTKNHHEKIWETRFEPIVG